MQGFQLWINLPASEKMRPPAYQEFPENKIAVEHLDNGGKVRVIAGSTDNGTTGPITNHFVDPVYIDVSLPEGKQFVQTVDAGENVFIFVISGQLSVGNSMRRIKHHQMGVLGKGDQTVVTAQKETRFLLAAAQPLNEPVARGGPFVMNTKAEILQAFDDFKHNKF